MRKIILILLSLFALDSVLMAQVKNGEKAPDFNYVNMDGDFVTLSSLRGKYVLIDIWATWCGPCKNQIPYLKKLEEKMKGRNLTFVSISIDDNKELWKKFVKENELGGIQLFYGGISKFMNAFKSTSVPRFILIDKKGKVVEGNFMRPSSEEEIYKYLDSLKGM